MEVIEKPKLCEQDIAHRIKDFLVHKENGNWHAELGHIAGLHERGPDMVVIGGKRNGEKFIIECKGKYNSASADRSSNKESWVTALGQLITRMDGPRTIQKGVTRGRTNEAVKYGLGLYWVGAKRALRRIPKQIAQGLCIHIFSVNDDGVVKQFTPAMVGKEYPDDAF